MIKVKIKDKADSKLVNTIIEALDDKKASEICFIDLTGIPVAICDYFVVCHAASKTQVSALAGWVKEKVQDDLGIKTYHAEGFQNAEWILLDFGSVIVHIFEEEKRHYYKIEDLWADAPIIEITETEPSYEPRTRKTK